MSKTKKKEPTYNVKVHCRRCHGYVTSYQMGTEDRPEDLHSDIEKCFETLRDRIDDVESRLCHR